MTRFFLGFALLVVVAASCAHEADRHDVRRAGERLVEDSVFDEHVNDTLLVVREWPGDVCALESGSPLALPQVANSHQARQAVVAFERWLPAASEHVSQASRQVLVDAVGELSSTANSTSDVYEAWNSGDLAAILNRPELRSALGRFAEQVAAECADSSLSTAQTLP